MRTLFFIAILFLVLCSAFALYLEHDTKRFVDSLGTPQRMDSAKKDVITIDPIKIPNTPRLRDMGGEEYKSPPESLENTYKADMRGEVPNDSDTLSNEEIAEILDALSILNDEALVETSKPLTDKKDSSQEASDPTEMSPEEERCARARAVIEEHRQRSPDMIIPIEDLLKNPVIASKLRGVPRGNAHVYLHRSPGEQKEIQEAVHILSE